MRELIKTILFAIAISIAMVSFFCFYGCNTVKKATHETKNKVDSVSLISNAKSNLSKSDSTSYHKENNQWQREIIINYDTANNVYDVLNADSSSVQIFKKYVHEPGNVFTPSTHQRIKNVIIHENGSQLLEELTNVARIDSNEIAATMSVVKHVEASDKQVNKESKRGTWLLMAVVGVLLLLYIIYRVRKTLL